MVNVCVLIPAKFIETNNPYDGMDPREADIEKHVEHVKRFGAVYWDMLILTGLCKGGILTPPTYCFFYDANPKSKTYRKVAYKAKIIEAYCLEELREIIKNDPKERNYIPNWRYQCINGKWSEENDWVVKAHPEWIGKAHKLSKVWIKLTNFEELNPPLEIKDFRRWNGSALKVQEVRMSCALNF